MIGMAGVRVGTGDGVGRLVASFRDAVAAFCVRIVTKLLPDWPS